MCQSHFRLACFLLLALLGFSSGCEKGIERTPVTREPESETKADTTAQAAVTEQPVSEPASEPTPVEPASDTAEGPGIAMSNAEDAGAGGTVHELDPNLAKKGSTLGGNYLETVGHARFFAEHKIQLDQVYNAIMLWSNLEGDGGYPKTEKQLRDALALRDIKLPELQDGYEYYYDVGEKTLGVREK